MTAEPTVVLLAYYYPPLGGIGSQRALSLARHLPDLGWRVVVVTPRRGAHPPDPSLGTGEAPGVTVIRTRSLEPSLLFRRRPPPGTPPGADLVAGRPAGGVTGLARRLLHGALYFPDHARGWAPFAAAAARRAARRHGAAVIVSTSPPVSAHLAALAAARATGAPAVLDFRDLFAAHRPAQDQSRRAERERRLERRLISGAAAVVAATEGQADWLSRFAPPRPGTPVTTIRNGFEEEDFAGAPPPRDPTVFRLVHAGTVYGARQDTTTLFRALSRVRAEGAFGARVVEVLLAGKVDPHTLAAAREAGCEGTLRPTGFVTHAEAVRLSRSATVNLLLVWSAPGPVRDSVCPGKMYEEMAAGRPILALSRPDGEAARLLRETGGALVADFDDEAAIADALRRLAAADAAGDALLAVPPRTGDLSRFTRRAAAARYAALLDALRRRGPAAPGA